MDETTDAVLEREIHIEASPETVFAFLTEPDKILQWMGVEATFEARDEDTAGLKRLELQPTAPS